MRVLWALLVLSVLGGCSACGSLQSASGAGGTRLAAAFAPPQTGQRLLGDATRLDVSGIVYWIERAGPSPDASALVRIVNLRAEEPEERILATQTVATRGRERPMRFAFSLDGDHLPPGAELGVEASIAGDQGGAFRTAAVLPIAKEGAKGLRLRLAPDLEPGAAQR